MLALSYCWRCVLAVHKYLCAHTFLCVNRMQIPHTGGNAQTTRKICRDHARRGRDSLWFVPSLSRPPFFQFNVLSFAKTSTCGLKSIV